MHGLFFVLGLLACPLGMLAFGGIAWAAPRLLRGRAPRLQATISHGGCASMTHGRAEETATGNGSGDASRAGHRVAEVASSEAATDPR